MFEVSKNSKGVSWNVDRTHKHHKILTFYQKRETSLYHVRRKQERGKINF